MEAQKSCSKKLRSLNCCICIRFILRCANGIEGKQVGGSMLMMIFILASGYLFSVYLLLALAKRTIKKTTATAVSSGFEGDYSSEMPITSLSE
ncbi:MAG: hypothetical protein AAF915_01315 [Cyanobacteria bacterium P01_D01_bin.50]